MSRVAEIIIAVADEMQELIRLRKRVAELQDERLQRQVANPVAKTVHDLVDGTVYKIRPTGAGLWDFSIDFLHHPTGGTGYESPEEAFRRMLEHIAYCWEQRERDYAGDEE